MYPRRMNSPANTAYGTAAAMCDACPKCLMHTGLLISTLKLPSARKVGTQRITTLSKLGRKRSDKKVQLVRFGHLEIETLGLNQGFWSDLYHRSMTVYWPVFFGSAAALFVTLNAVFGFLYSLGHEPMANAAGNGPLAYF